MLAEASRVPTSNRCVPLAAQVVFASSVKAVLRSINVQDATVLRGKIATAMMPKSHVATAARSDRLPT